MKPAFYTGASGLAAFQTKMNMIGHNMANINTNGYKKEHTAFQDLLYNDMYVNSDKTPLTGHGVKATSAGIQFTQGELQNVGGEYNFAIVGDGLFAVENGEETEYTRDGAFLLTVEGDTAYLTTGDGAYVLDADGNRIEIENELDGPDRVYPAEGEEGTDTDTGNNTETDDNQTEEAPAEYEPTLMDKIGIYVFQNPNGLIPVGGNRFTPSDISGEASAAEPGVCKLIKGYNEGSGVSMADGMVEMITAQRAFQISARVVQAADEMEQMISSLRK